MPTNQPLLLYQYYEFMTAVRIFYVLYSLLQQLIVKKEALFQGQPNVGGGGNRQD